METLYEPYSGQNNDPLKDVHTQILRTCELCYFYGQRNIAATMKLRILRGEDYSELFEWPQ